MRGNFHLTPLSVFSIMFVGPTPGGGFCHGYVDVAPREEYRTPVVAAASLRRRVALCDGTWVNLGGRKRRAMVLRRSLFRPFRRDGNWCPL